MISLSIIIPLYNEEKRLKKTITILKKFIKKFKKKKIEIIFVDDGSTDETITILKRMNFIKSKNLKKKNNKI